METKFRPRALPEWADLETFLSGMETGGIGNEEYHKGPLETFLSGMETSSTATQTRDSSDALKPSLVEWKLHPPPASPAALPGP